MLFICMGFNINEYDNRRFHNDELIHKRIKALFLWYEYQVYSKRFEINEQTILLNNIEEMALSQEWYEIAIFFRDERKKN